jgi:transcriptional regulator with XRE-family HTH domain
MVRTHPSVRARQLAAELRRLRESATLTGDEVAGQLGWSPAKVSRIENGRIAVSAADLRHLLDLYQVSGSRRERLVELGRTATQRGWWDAYNDTLRQGYSTLLGLENDAESERFYAPTIIPGLLQAQAYAQEIIRTGFVIVPPGEVERRVRVRVTRQQVLTRDNPLEFTTVIDEATLRRQVGGADVMNEQLLHLVKIAALPNISIQVLPFAAGSHPAMQGGFAILQFPEIDAPDVVYLENMTSDLFVEDEREVYQYSLVFDRLREMALGRQDSIALITRLAGETG